MTKRSAWLLSVATVLLAVGCDGAPSAESTDTVPQGIVSVDKTTGAQTIKWVQVPRSQYEATVKVKRLLSEGRISPEEQAEYINALNGDGNQSSLDPSCVSDDFWLFLGLNQTGAMLCYSELSTAGATSIAASNFPGTPIPGNYGESFWAGKWPGRIWSANMSQNRSYTQFQAANWSFVNWPWLDQQ